MIIRLHRRSTLFGLIFLFLSEQSSISAQEKESSDSVVRPNLEIIRSGVATLTMEIMKKSDVGTEKNLLVEFRTSDTSGVIRNALLETLKGMKYNVFLSSSTAKREGASLDIGPVETRVHYGRAFRESFLGKRKTARTIEVAVTANIRNAGDEVLFAGSVSRAFSDTIHVGDLPDLETPSIPLTQGEPPEGGFFDTVLEPFIIIGASAIAVYLFFTVRS